MNYQQIKNELKSLNRDFLYDPGLDRPIVLKCRQIGISNFTFGDVPNIPPIRHRVRSGLRV